jgi:hypothetical protein
MSKMIIGSGYAVGKGKCDEGRVWNLIDVHFT